MYASMGFLRDVDHESTKTAASDCLETFQTPVPGGFEHFKKKIAALKKAQPEATVTVALIHGTPPSPDRSIIEIEDDYEVQPYISPLQDLSSNRTPIYDSQSHHHQQQQQPNQPLYKNEQKQSPIQKYLSHHLQQQQNQSPIHKVLPLYKQQQPNQSPFYLPNHQQQQPNQSENNKNQPQQTQQENSTQFQQPQQQQPRLTRSRSVQTPLSLFEPITTTAELVQIHIKSFLETFQHFN